MLELGGNLGELWNEKGRMTLMMKIGREWKRSRWRGAGI